jgi:hypothetical protein
MKISADTITVDFLCRLHDDLTHATQQIRQISLLADAGEIDPEEAAKRVGKALKPLQVETNHADSIIREIAAEIDRATTKFPTWPTDPIHAANVVMEEAGELSKEVNQLTYEPHKSSKEWVRKEAIQTAAMAIRFLMSLDRYEFTAGKQHKQ